jgi:hypothetical protein
MKLKALVFFVVVFAADSRAERSFLVQCRDLAESAPANGSPVVEGRDGWLFFAPELRHLGAGPFWGEAAASVSRAKRDDAKDPFPAIKDFHASLQARGVELILAPVPPKAVARADKLFEGARGRADEHHQAFYRLLRGEGITVLDLTEALSADENAYCRQDTHWSGRGCIIAAENIAGLVKPLLEGIAPKVFATTTREIEITGDLWQMKNDPALLKESIALRIVEGATPDPASPVILLGDSHTLVFHAGGDMHATGAGLADQLAVELGVPVDLIGVRGSGATPARLNLFRRAQSNPDYWTGKKVVIWVFAAREFTESDGWRVLPIAP